MLKNLIKKDIFLIISLVILSIVKVAYQFFERGMFEYDQEYLANAAKSIIVAHKLTLIGAPTSVGGMFIGPFYNYLSAFIFWLFHMNPQAINVLTAFWDPLTIALSFLIIRDLFDRRIAIISCCILVGSLSFNFFPLNPPLVHGIPILSLIALWSLVKARTNDRYLLFTAASVGFAFHLHFSAIVILLVVILFSFVLNISADKKTYLFAALILILFISPLIIFDLRNHFLIVSNASLFAQTYGGKQMAILMQAVNVLSIALSDFAFLLSFNKFKALSMLVATGVIFFSPGTIFLHAKKMMVSAFLIFLWILSYTSLFFFYRGIILPYYFSPLEIPFAIICALAVNSIRKKYGKIALLILALTYFTVNVNQWLTFTSPMGLEHKLDALKFIKHHSRNQTIYLSHTIKKGFEGGFDYLEWYEQVNIKNDKTFPIYTLIVPYDWIDTPLDYKSGDIGVIVPK